MNAHRLLNLFDSESTHALICQVKYLLQKHVLWRSFLTARTCVSVVKKNVSILEILVLIICVEMSVLHLRAYATTYIC